MKHFRVWQKLALLGLVFLIPFAVVAYRLVASVSATVIDFGQKEVYGLHIAAPLRDVLQHLQQHESAADAGLRGDATFKPIQSDAAKGVQDSLQAVDAALGKYQDDFTKTKAWPALKTEISN